MSLVYRIAARYLKARKDRELQAQAQAIYQNLYDFMKKVDLWDLPTTQNDDPVAVGKVYWDEFVGEGLPLAVFSKNSNPKTSELLVIFYLEGERTFHAKRDSQSSIIGIGMKNLMQFIPSHGEVKKDLLNLLGKRRSVIIHELTHYLDAVRNRRGYSKARDSYKVPDTDPHGYYNHPLELNAYFMQGLSDLIQEIENEIKLIDSVKNDNHHQVAVYSVSEWLDKYGDNFKNFHKAFWRKIPSGFLDHLTTQNKRRQDKRVYDTWYKLNKELKGIKKDLLDRGDSAAKIMF